GTVGHPIPGVIARAVDPESGRPLGYGEEGLLLVKGPNVMLGYLNQPKLVAFYAQNGVSKEELWEKLNQSELPKLWIPKRENLHPIDALPLLGSGKVDLKKIKAMAEERSRTPAS